MKKIQGLFAVVGTIAKYAGIIMIFIEAVELIQTRLKEKFPESEAPEPSKNLKDGSDISK